MAYNQLKPMSVERCRELGRREPASCLHGSWGDCVWCGKYTGWQIRGFPICLRCNDKPENRGPDGLADADALTAAKESRA